MSIKDEMLKFAEQRRARNSERITALTRDLQEAKQRDEGYRSIIADLQKSDSGDSTEAPSAAAKPPLPLKPGVKMNMIELGAKILSEKSEWMTKRDLWDAMVERGMVSKSAHPANSMEATIGKHIRMKVSQGRKPHIIRVNGLYGLPEWQESQPSDEPESVEK